jgi:ribonuclease HI
MNHKKMIGRHDMKESKKRMPAKEAFYAVAVGKAPGIYNTWDECKRMVTGVPNAKYKKFDTKAAADSFVSSFGSSVLSQLGVMFSKMEVRDMGTTTNSSESLPKDALVVFTDGSAINNGKRSARAGWAAVWPNHERHTAYGAVPATDAQTNNRGEYMAALNAFRSADMIDPSGSQTLHIFTDSQLLINSITKWMAGWSKNGWKTANGGPVQHQDLLREIHERASRRRVKWVHVDAHTGGSDWKSVWNDKADMLAKQGAQS